MIIDALQEILFTIGKNKLRTFLTAFGVFWGILMLILLLGVGKGLENAADSNFGSDDRTSIWLHTSRTSIPYKGLPRGRQIEFTEDDIFAIKQQLKGVQYISAENRAGQRWKRTINVTHKNKAGAFGVYGVANDYFNIKRYLDYRTGRTLNVFDNAGNRKVAIIGTRVQERLFNKGEDPIDKLIYFHGIALKVVGVFYDDGRQGRMSERVYVPLSTFQQVFGRAKKVGLITLTPKPDMDPFQFEEDVISLLKQRHKISPDDTKAIGSHNFAESMEQVTQLFAAVSVFIWFVGLGTLTAGIVGISNIMIITVKDRTREIGVRKALGAAPNNIVAMVMFESVLITTIAGYCGLVVGVGIIELIHLAMNSGSVSNPYFSQPEVSIQTAIAALMVLISSGALAGLAPALRAARILPVEAMREE